MAKPWKSIPRRSKSFELVVSRDGEDYFTATLKGQSAATYDSVKMAYEAAVRAFPESERFHVHVYETRSIRRLKLGPEMDGPMEEWPEGDDPLLGGETDDVAESQTRAEQNPDDELDHAVDILRQVVGPNQTAIEALDILLKQASGIPGPPLPKKESNG